MKPNSIIFSKKSMYFHKSHRLSHKGFFIFLAFLIISVEFSSCKKDIPGKCFKSIGEINTESRLASDFTTIDLSGHINLIITQDTIYSLEVEAGNNLLPYINTTVNNNTLFISNDNKCDWMRSYKQDINVYVSVVDLKEIIYKGTGNISTTDTLKVNDLLVQQWGGAGTISLIIETNNSSFILHTGTGDLKVSGKSQYNYFYSSSYAWIDAAEFITYNTFAHHKGTGDFIIGEATTLKVNIESMGSIYYSGNPANLEVNISGTGKLVKQ